ncbi:2-phospho-L-lactate guanylyltransferase [Rhodococcus sp. B10]|uniref:2-phospho-L-lactate guanylyltransferase n=1 Tax=Rhodococcus sp. B10 TaxID=2695876 RepID=UPI00143068EF|nr:2-phospho-L-lactate guanylyltransferase [Rhodococcus sp. B10]NIL78367.1 2-phospho-L-lactate guanylyltransferase [Rhodococcus sp. B10]
MWSVLVPVKPLTAAKSRLDVGDMRKHYALAFAQDTVAALSGCPDVAVIFAITADPVVREAQSHSRVVFLDDLHGDLNRSVAAGLGLVRRLAPDTHTAVVMADLPALTPEEFSEVCFLASQCGESYVSDREGFGTTALFSTGDRLRPKFGPGSAGDYAAAGYTELAVHSYPGIRRDVDTVEHLEAAARLGVGRATKTLMSKQQQYVTVNS